VTAVLIVIDPEPGRTGQLADSRIEGAIFGVHPDIVFGSGWAVADVKYKLSQEGWNRPDLYEVVAFAAAFRCLDAALICFSGVGLPPRTVAVGETNVRRVAWNCGVDPVTASRALGEAISDWLHDAQKKKAAQPNRGSHDVEIADNPLWKDKITALAALQIPSQS
jgi:hypothetical protein